MCGSCWQGPLVQYWPCQSDCARGGFSGHHLFSKQCLTPTMAAKHLSAWLLVQGQRAEVWAASAAEMLFVQFRRPSASSLMNDLRAKRMRSPAKLSSQTTFSVCSAASCLHSRGVVQSAVEPKGRVASFPHVSEADSKGIEVLNPVGARTQPCSALMPSETKRPASNPTHQLPCGKSRSGLRFRKRY